MAGGRGTASSVSHDILKPLPEAPSSALYYFSGPAVGAPDASFKPGWNRKARPAVNPELARSEEQAKKEQRNAAFAGVRRERLVENQERNRFNPISHLERGADGSWSVPTDPWAHQRVGIRSQEPRAAAASTLQMQAESTRRAVDITHMRQERIANGGLSRHPGGTMKDALSWQ